MAKTKRKNAQTKSNDKLKMLKDLPTCVIVLHNIALNKDLVRLYNLRFPEKKKEKLKHSSSCINNIPKNSNNVWMLKENMREDNAVAETSRITRCSKKLAEKKMEECKSLKFFKNESYVRCPKIIQPGFVAQEQQLKRDVSVKSLSSISNNETSVTSSSIYCNYTREKTVPTNNKRRDNSKRLTVQKKSACKRKLCFDQSGTSLESVKISFDSDNYLAEKNSTITDYSSKIQEIPDEIHLKVPRMKTDTEYYSLKKYNNNLYATGIANGKICEIQLEQCDRNQSIKAAFSNIINTNLENKVFGTSEVIKTKFKSKNTNLSNNHSTYDNINECQNQKDTKVKSSRTSLATDNTTQVTDASESFVLRSSYSTAFKTNHITKTISDFVTTCNTKQYTNKTNNETKKNVPKIIENCILPKGAIRVMKASTNDELLENNFLQQDLEQDEYNTHSYMKEASCIDNTFQSTNTFRKKEHPAFKIDGSISALNNNINLRDKNINDTKLHSTKIDCTNDSLMKVRSNIHNNVKIDDADSETTCEDCTLNHQEQSPKLDNKEDKSNTLQDDKYNETESDENILNDSFSNFTDVSESSNVNRSLILVDKKEVIRQNSKRIAEENTTDIKDNKRKKLNRTVWLQNDITCAKSLNQQLIELNIDEKNDSKESKPDLREHLNKKRIKQPFELPTFEDKSNNKNDMTSKQIDLANENDMVTSTNIMKNEEFHKKFSFDKELVSSKTLYKEKEKKNIQSDSVCNNRIRCDSTLQSTSKETQHIHQMDSIREDTDTQKIYTINEDKDDDDDDNSNNDDSDCISLFAESFDTNLYENTFSSEKKKPNKSLHSDTPYMMTVSSFNEFMNQTATEFNKEYAKYEEKAMKFNKKNTGYKENAIKFNKKCAEHEENSTEISNKANETKREYDNQSEQTTSIDCIPETRIASRVILKTKNKEILKYPLKVNNIKNLLNGYCFAILRKGNCYNQLHCRYTHNLQNLIKTVCSEEPRTMLDVIQELLGLGYNCLCQRIYLMSLQKLTIDEILMMYQMFHDVCLLKDELTMSSKNYITQNTIIELLNRQVSLKTIVNLLVEYIASIKSSNIYALKNFLIILTCIEKHIKRGEYWDTIRTLVLRLPPNELPEHVIQKILIECIENEKFTDIQDINYNLVDKVPPMVISTSIKERFKSLLVKKTASNPCSLVQNFGENLFETIASPDGSTSLQTESPRCSSTLINKSTNNMDCINKMNGDTYTLQPIDDLPDPRSAYRDHEHLWKFYVDLDRFKKGLIHNDYDYVINILKLYTKNQNETSLFIRSCCSILRTEVKRSEHHLANIIRRTGEMLFDIGLNILTDLVDKEAWGLALWLTQTFNMYNLPYNAEYFLLLAEIYLANKKAVKAYDLLKSRNIICTSRDKWYVRSTINDERVRNKIMYILLDSFCNEFVEYAFFLFQFLLKDQCSQYYPIDLSCYVDKLIVLSLSKENTNLIIEMANLVLKYTFAVSTISCRALISTLIHLDENLARQMYSYAEGVGIYTTIKLWPVTYIIINNHLTEEEVYLTFLQLLKNVLTNFGHAIEFAKPQQIKVYLILEIKSTNEQFYCAELQNYYNKNVITNMKTLVRNVLKNRFDPPILLMPHSKDNSAL